MTDLMMTAPQANYLKIEAEIRALGTVAEVVHLVDGKFVRRDKPAIVSKTIQRPWRDICDKITEIFSGPLHGDQTWVEIYEIGGPAPYRYAVKFAIDSDLTPDLYWLVG